MHGTGAPCRRVASGSGRAARSGPGHHREPGTLALGDLRPGWKKLPPPSYVTNKCFTGKPPLIAGRIGRPRDRSKFVTVGPTGPRAHHQDWRRLTARVAHGFTTPIHIGSGRSRIAARPSLMPVSGNRWVISSSACRQATSGSRPALPGMSPQDNAAARSWTADLDRGLGTDRKRSTREGHRFGPCLGHRLHGPE